MTDKEKLEKAVKLADAMYHAAQYLTTDASRLHKAMDEYHQFIITEYNRQEPASEDLEQAAMDYRNKTEFQYPNQLQPAYEGFKAGAQWQKTQDQQTIELAEEHAMLAGMMQEREQMMKDAVTGLIADNYLDVIKLRRSLPEDKYKAFQSVKVIIIKK